MGKPSGSNIVAKSQSPKEEIAKAFAARGSENHVRLAPKADIGCVLDYRSVGDAAVTATPVYARDTDWSSRIGLLRRTPMLAFS
jgi:hypothetical protein